MKKVIVALVLVCAMLTACNYKEAVNGARDAVNAADALGEKIDEFNESIKNNETLKEGAKSINDYFNGGESE